MSAPSGTDAILREVIRHELLSVTEDMNITMQRTTRSIVAKETNDFSAAILDASGTPVMLAMPYGLRVFAHGAPFVIEKHAGNIRPGDVYLSNDPYRGTSHLPDILVMMPIFYADELVGFAATYQHHTDIGGRFPGGFGTQSTELFEEGLRLPLVHFYREGKPEQSVHDIIAANVRAPHDVLGDLEANAAACRRGASGIAALMERYGRDAIFSSWREFVSATEQFVRDLVRSIPDGSYSAHGSVDDGAGTHFDIALTAIVNGDDLTIDLTGTSPQVATAWNVPPGMAMDAVYPMLLGLLPYPELVVNAGLLNPINLIAPLGTVVNPTFPAAVASRAQAIFVMWELMLEVLAEAMPGRIPAPGEGGNPILIFRSDTGLEDSAMAVDLWCGGWGARPTMDGIDGVVNMVMNGFQNSSGELMELSSLFSLEGFGYVRDSGGRGEYRGCTSLYRRFRVNRKGRIMLRTIRATDRTPGREGGGAGGEFSATLVRDHEVRELPRQCLIDIDVLPGDVVEHVVAGGGGYGDPMRRDPALVLGDVLDEKVSVGSARQHYGVAIDAESLKVDEDETERLRAAAG